MLPPCRARRGGIAACAQKESTAQIGVEHDVEIVLGCFFERHVLGDTGVRDHDVQPTEAALRRGDDLGHVLAVANVADNDLDLTAGSHHFIGGLTKAVQRTSFATTAAPAAPSATAHARPRPEPATGDRCDLAHWRRHSRATRAAATIASGLMLYSA